MVKEIHTENTPAAIGPYSLAIEVGDFINVSGQIGVDPPTEKVSRLPNRSISSYRINSSNFK